MKLALAQMQMTSDIAQNAQHAVAYCRKAGQQHADLLFFPEVQMTPFFPQYRADSTPYPIDTYLMAYDSEPLMDIAQAARDAGCYVSPNVWLDEQGATFDTSLLFDRTGCIVGVSKMVHICQAPHFYEQDYYTSSDSGFRVYNTDFGRMGIVICFDRHLPESIRTCALQGAQLVIIPTANTADEPLEAYEWEVRVQAMQNQVYVAMCNRIGTEGGMAFAGESLIAAPDGSVVAKAGRNEQLLIADLDLSATEEWRRTRPWLGLRRPEWYA